MATREALEKRATVATLLPASRRCPGGRTDPRGPRQLFELLRDRRVAEAGRKTLYPANSDASYRKRLSSSRKLHGEERV